MFRMTTALSTMLFVACGVHDVHEKNGGPDNEPQPCQLRLNFGEKAPGDTTGSTFLTYKTPMAVPKGCLRHVGKPANRLRFGLDITARNSAGKINQLSIGQGRVAKFNQEFHLTDGTIHARNLQNHNWVGVLDSYANVEVIVSFQEISQNIAISNRPLEVKLLVEDQTE